MRKHGFQNYFNNEVLAASPLKLILMLYGAALDSIATARRHVRRGEIRDRTRAINRAIGIMSELSRCLNYEAGGALSRSLANLYNYIVGLLIAANTQQSEAPLAEAEALLSTLGEAWKACSPATPENGFPHPEALAAGAELHSGSSLVR